MCVSACVNDVWCGVDLTHLESHAVSRTTWGMFFVVRDKGKRLLSEVIPEVLCSSLEVN